MLRDRAAPVDLFALVPALELRFEPELAELDRLLEDDVIFQQVKADLSRRRPHTMETGRPSTPVEVILRLLVIQHLYKWSYAQTEHFVGDSLVLRQFCRVGLDRVPHHTTLMRWANVWQPETMHRLLDRVTELARSLKVTRGRKLRIDGTVVATAIHYPTDSTLLADGVRVLGRTVQRAVRVLTGQVRRLGSRRLRQAKQLARRIDATTAVNASAAARAERPTLYTRLLAVAQASLRQAEQIRRALAERSDAVVQRLESALKHVAPLVQQVITQTERRVLHGESVPASAKLVSLFEPHTAIVRRGKAHVPAEFGRKVVLDEVDGGLVTRYVVLVGNPPEASELPHSLAHHQASFARAPAVLTADRAFSTLENEQLARDVHIRSVAVPRQGPLTPQQQQVQHRAAFRRAYCWRAGIEGRISVLKRRFGLDRCRYHGEAGMERWVGFGLLAHNLRQISHSLASR
ncbi:MAG: ISNCY family transposase [Chloroflexi bacterium]|nr:MAG: ISNCY family transposase [Chloroflexota bacterium]